MEKDNEFMRRAFQLALKGYGSVSPNPMVGAVVVKNNTVVGEGYHLGTGCPHAEVVALEQAGASARGATLYVNLEPCCHFGRTPPCVDRVISAGITRVVCGMVDPNPLVSGKGI
ncbi:MAG TPA: bifunctional diaminohydroxyphosphoribosylaminopyrimidine deaminase/5-amino-6-(5-phosphoribosylamino)uracil reductase RibD, partial [Clostridia bacterium]|nr:bifunctional diaminohydroxyphosphoribosylaminopyrimidine deaminase/5-amino-6-(5-phosphoribosylamino)uracil reductase RibD [Clostridia bacterium]